MIFISNAARSEFYNQKSFILLKGRECIQHVVSQKSYSVYLFCFVGHDTGGDTTLLQSCLWRDEAICALRNDRNSKGQNPWLVEGRL